jgi:hypothetical protein
MRFMATIPDALLSPLSTPPVKPTTISQGVEDRAAAASGKLPGVALARAFVNLIWPLLML